MPNLARFAAETKPQGAAPRHVFARPLLGRLPARLADLSDEARGALGRALDQGRARLLLDDDGGVLVFPRGRI